MSPGLFFALPNLVKISVSGADSERYLNNRLSNNIKAFSDSPQMMFAAALSAQGRTEGFFTVCKLAKDDYLLCSGSSEESSSEILKALSRYKVADRVIFKLLDDSCAVHVTDPEVIQTIKSELPVRITAYTINRTGTLGLDLIIHADEKEVKEILVRKGLTEINQPEILRYKAKIPSFPEEMNEDLLLQESGLSQSYSTAKGCYVGQEVTQKIDSFASLPYKLYAFKTGKDISPSGLIGQALFTENKTRAGEIISAVADSDSIYGFARIKKLSDKLTAGDRIFEISEIFDFTSEDKKCFYSE